MKENNERYFSTADKTFLQLCDEVDMWKAQAEYWKERYEETNKDFNTLLNNGIQSGKELTGKLLSIMLNGEQKDEGFVIKQNDNP